MRDELTTLLGMLNQVEEARGVASLSISTRGGKTSIKFAIELEDVSPPPPPSTATTLPSAPGNQAAGKRPRNRGAAARAHCQQRAAAYQAMAATSPLRPPPSRPLHHLLSPSPASGRRRVMSVGRPEMPNFSCLNMDGSCSPTPPPPPTSPPPVAPLPSPPCEQEADTPGNQVQVEFRCDQCEDTFKSEAYLAIHKGKAHNDWRFRNRLSWSLAGRRALAELRL